MMDLFNERTREQLANAAKDAEYCRSIPLPFTKEQIQNPTEEEFYQIANFRNNIHVPEYRSGSMQRHCRDTFTPKAPVTRAAWERYQKTREIREKLKSMPKHPVVDGCTWTLPFSEVYMNKDNVESNNKVVKGDSPSISVEETVSSAQEKLQMEEVEGKEADMKEKRKMVQSSAGLPLEKKMKLQDTAEQVFGECSSVSLSGKVVDLMREEIKRQMNAMKREMKSQMEMQLESFWKEAEEKLLLSLTSKFSGEYTKSPVRTTSEP